MKSLLTMLLLVIVIGTAQGSVLALEMEKDQIVTVQDVPDFDIVANIEVVGAESVVNDAVNHPLIKQNETKAIKTPHGLKSDGYIKRKYDLHLINYELLKTREKTLKYVTPFRDCISWFYLYHKKL